MARKIPVMSFIDAARCDDPTRYFMLDPYWDHEAARVVATDGRRLHYWQLNKSAPDYGEFIEAWGLPLDRSMYLQAVPDLGKYVEKKVDAQFPAYAKVIPDYMPTDAGLKAVGKLDSRREEDQAALRAVTFKNPTKNGRAFGVPTFLLASQCPISLPYLLDLEGWDWIWATASETPASRAVAFRALGNVPGPEGSSLHAVIMPFNPAFGQ